MSKPIRNIFRSLLNKADLAGMLQLKINSAVKDDGWFRSYRIKESVDKDGNPIPWCTYPCVKFIEPRLNKKLNVFEYGSGNSTLWYAERVKFIASVEHNKEWFEKIKPSLPENTNLMYQPETDPEGYVNNVGMQGLKFDIIVIDGILRNECTEESVNHLSGNGVIVFDNSERKDYLQSVELLKSDNFRQIDFTGLGPVTSIQTTTSIFYKTDNCLDI